MTTTLLTYIAAAYASMGTAVFVYLLAYNTSGLGAPPDLSDCADSDEWSTATVVVALIVLLLFCMLVWPYALRVHRRDLVRIRNRRAWRDLP